MRQSKVTWFFVILILGFVGAARRRVRSTTATAATMTTTPALYVGRHSAFAGQTEELENLWDKFDIQKLDSRSEAWSNLNNTSKHHDEIILSRQYPGIPENPGDTNELPSPISPPVPIRPPQYPPGCLGPRGQYPSPKSCVNYLNCWDNVVVEQSCPAGLLFNDITGYCDFDYNVNCGNRPPATPKPPMAPGSKICPDPNGRYRSSTNCSEFYVCVTGRPIKFSCPRGLVYSDILNVCDYPYNVDCKGSATPKPTKPPTYPPAPTKPPTYPPTQPPPPSRPPYAPQPPTYAPQPPTYAPQPPTYAPQPPTYAPQSPTYQPQPPKPPSYQPQPHPPAPPSYPSNPWLNKEHDPWHQRHPATQLEIDEERQKQEATVDDGQLLGNPPADVTETSDLTNPWTIFEVVPPELMNASCENGDVHRLNDACTNVVVCRNNRPQMMKCSTGLSYDKPSDSCRPFSVAKC